MDDDKIVKGKFARPLAFVAIIIFGLYVIGMIYVLSRAPI
jgi:type IV secretory pathway VirB2 component (pilin)